MILVKRVKLTLKRFVLFFSLSLSPGASSCKTPHISFANLSQDPELATEVEYSSPFMVKAFLESHIDLKAKVTWKIAYLENSHRSELDRTSSFKSIYIDKQEVNITNKTTITLEILPQTLPYSVYYVEVLIEEKNSSNCVNFNYGFLRIIESPPQAVISATPSVNILLQGYNKELKLDASGSFDPDEPNADKRTFKYTWLCARKSETLRNIPLLPVVAPDGIKSSNEGGCYGHGPGKLNFTGSTAMLFLDKMVAEERYVITLILEKGKRKTNISYEFALNKVNTFGVNIR